MEFFKQKKNILFILCLVAGLFTFLTLCFSLLSAFGEGINGFDYIKNDVEGWKSVFTKIVSILILVAAIVLIAYTVFAYFKGIDMIKVAKTVICVALISAVLYLIAGILLKSEIPSAISSYYSVKAFWPLIIQVLICGGAICAGKLMKD